MAGIKLSSLMTAISALSVTLSNGKQLKILGAGTLPDDATRLGGVLFPKPDGFISGVSAEPQTYGVNGAESINVSYVLTYVFCDIPGGSGRSLADNYAVLVDDTILVMNKIITNDTIVGGVDLRLGDVINFGLVYDPAGNAFYGTEIKLSVLDYYEV